MAKITPIYGEMRGKVGGSIFSRNRGGLYVKTFASPVNPNSSRQQIARTILAINSSAWTALTSGQRDAWQTWADNNPRTDSLGNSFTLTGHQAFCALNSNLRHAGLPATSNPPTGPAPAPPTLGTSTWDPALETVTIAFAPSPLPANHRLFAFYSGSVKVTQNPNFNQCRWFGVSSSAQVTPWVEAPGDYGIPDVSKLVLYVAIIAPDGQISTYQRLDIVASD